MPYRTLALEALEAWRTADARLAACEPDSLEWHEAFTDAELAKKRYQDAIDAARVEHLPEPPPFKEAIKRGPMEPMEGEH